VPPFIAAEGHVARAIVPNLVEIAIWAAAAVAAIAIPCR
jgi:hypothetical protein